MKGSIKKRGKKADSWTLIYDGPAREDGRRNQKWEAFRGTHEAAKRALAKRIYEVTSGSYVDSPDVTLAAYLDSWLEHHKHQATDWTCDCYRSAIRTHIKPCLGRTKLANLKPSMLQSYYTKLLDGKLPTTRRPLSPKTVYLHHSLLHSALEEAVRMQVIPRNPADMVTPPKVGRSVRSVLSDEQVNKLLEVMEGSVYYIPTLLAVGLGVRRGEALGLRWEDVDLDRGVLVVRRSLCVTGVLKEPKSGKYRAVTLGEVITSEMRRHLEEQRLREAIDPAYSNPEGYVCTTETGGLWNARSFGNRWAYLYKQAGIKDGITYHDLRHTNATILLASGSHIKVVSERLGHTSISITYNLYSHVTEPMQREAASHMDSVIKPPKRDEKRG